MKSKSAHTMHMQEASFGLKMIKRAVAVAVAFGAGIANGFFGGGGGMLVVPCLIGLCGLDRKSAHATAIAVILPLSVLSAFLYTLSGVYSVGCGVYVGIGVLLGGVLGAIFLNKIPKELLTLLFYGVMIYAGIRMVLQ